MHIPNLRRQIVSKLKCSAFKKIGIATITSFLKVHLNSSLRRFTILCFYGTKRNPLGNFWRIHNSHASYANAYKCTPPLFRDLFVIFFLIWGKIEFSCMHKYLSQAQIISTFLLPLTGFNSPITSQITSTCQKFWRRLWNWDVFCVVFCFTFIFSGARTSHI